MLDDVEAVVFDLGGTLVEYALPSWPAMLGQCVDAAYGFLVRPQQQWPPPAAPMPSPAEAQMRRRRIGRDTALLHRVTMGLRRIIRAVSSRTLPAIAEACARPLMATGRVYEDALPTLRTLRVRGYRLGLISNTPWGTPDYLWEKQVEKFHLAPLMDVRLFSSGVGIRKPDPRIFREALRRLGTAAARAIFVGDSPREDVAGARGVGMRTALVVRQNGLRKAQKSISEADLYIPTLAELLTHLSARPN